MTSNGDSLVDGAGSSPVIRCAFPISEFCHLYGIGRTTAYREIAAGRLRAVKVGRRTLITRDAAEIWLAALPELNRPGRRSPERRDKQR